MKNILGLFVLSVLVLSPIVTPQVVSAATNDTQTTLLIQLLLEKVKMLQVELEVLLKTKSETVKVEIISEDAEYKKEVKPFVDSLDEKQNLRKELMVKLEQSQCFKPYRYTSKGVVKFTCRDANPTFTSTTTLSSIIPISQKSEKYIKDIELLDKEIEDINSKIKSLKTRYGI